MELELVISRHGRSIRQDAVIFREGEAAGELYIIQQGQVRILKRVEGEDMCLAVLGEGDFFGEEVLDSSPRTNTAQAASEVLAVVLDRDTFLRILNDSSEVRRRVIGRLCLRLREMVQRLASQVGQDELARVAKALLEFADKGDPRPGGRRILSWSASDDSLLACKAGILPSRAHHLMGRLERSRLLGRLADGRLWVASGKTLEDFLDFCEMKRRFDPLPPEDLASLAGMGPGEVEVLTQRVMRRHAGRLPEGESGRALLTPFQRYLLLKQQFEGAAVLEGAAVRSGENGS